MSFGTLAYVVKRMTVDQLEELHTGVLMKRREELLSCEEFLSWPPGAHEKRLEEFESAEFIEYKETKLWKQAYADLLGVLSKREHVLTGEQRKQRRLDKAKQQKSNEKRKRR